MKKIVEKLKTNKMITKICVCALVFVVAAGGISYWSNVNKPELTTYVDVDPEGTITISEEEVPLGNTKVLTKKTRTVKKPKKTQTTKKTTTTRKQIVTVQTTKEIAVTEKYKKNAKQKVVTTKVTTTVQTTTTDVKSGSGAGSSAVQLSTSKGGVTLYTIDIQSAAPKADESVRKAFETLGFTVTVNSGVSYSGYFNARNQQIILQQQDATIYHELGHFVAFLAGNADKSSAFVDAYNAEKGLYTGSNKAYVTQSSAEYFAESYKDYVLQPKELKSSRPQTYEIVNNSVEKLTDSYVAKIKVLYGPIWK